MFTRIAVDLQVSRCPEHQMAQFVNSLLALPCGSQRQRFFLSFECVRSVFRAQPKCLALAPGLWGVGRNYQNCWHLPQAFECLKEPVLAKCFQDGVDLLADSLKQYGCNLVQAPDQRTKWRKNTVLELENGAAYNVSIVEALPPTTDNLASSQLTLSAIDKAAVLKIDEPEDQQPILAKPELAQKAPIRLNAVQNLPVQLTLAQFTSQHKSKPAEDNNDDVAVAQIAV